MDHKDENFAHKKGIKIGWWKISLNMRPFPMIIAAIIVKL
jgi:hypothetical protein